MMLAQMQHAKSQLSCISNATATASIRAKHPRVMVCPVCACLAVNLETAAAALLACRTIIDDAYIKSGSEKAKASEKGWYQSFSLLLSNAS
jgi:hypothetical protein